MSRAPEDRTLKYDWDLPGEGEDDAERVELEKADALSAVGAREEARLQKATSRALTESKAFGILAAYVESQRQANINKLLLTVITKKNRDEFNYDRGVVHGLMIAVKFAEAIAKGAEGTLELLEEAAKMERKDAAGTE